MYRSSLPYILLITLAGKNCSFVMLGDNQSHLTNDSRVSTHSVLPHLLFLTIISLHENIIMFHALLSCPCLFRKRLQCPFPTCGENGLCVIIATLFCSCGMWSPFPS